LPKSLKSRIFAGFSAVIIGLALCIFALGFYVIKTHIFDEHDSLVKQNLTSANSVYKEEIAGIGRAFNLVSFEDDLNILKDKIGLDYLFLATASKAKDHASSIVRKASAQGAVGGSRIIKQDELAEMGQALLEKVKMPVLYTPKARPADKGMVVDAMAYEFALKLKNGSVVYGGKVVNRNFKLIDRINDFVFKSDLYQGKPVGTVTIFQEDVRVATNVLNAESQPAVGTRVSEVVYDRVIGEGKPWYGPAFVVTDRYRSAYEPILNIDDEIIGILYVGTLEKVFTDRMRDIVLVFVLIIALASLLGVILSYAIASSISKPLTRMSDATDRLASGDLGHEVPRESVEEVNSFAKSFNKMSANLNERDIEIKVKTEKLEELNKSYLDLIGFVAHELKGILASTIMNSYSLRDGYLGMINFKQQRAINSITRNLDYLAATVKKFLNLSRIEKGQLDVNRTEFCIGPQMLDICIETFEKQASVKEMRIENNIDQDLVVNADLDLMQIVGNNLLGNAIKYGNKGGLITIDAKIEDSILEVAVYNDGRPIDDEGRKKLFKKFSRLDVPEKRKVKGTGLGLFITKQIVESHGGKIDVMPGENGNTFVFTMNMTEDENLN
jgi:two-component system NtrC family sensor kinase